MKELLEARPGVDASLYVPTRRSGNTIEGPARLGNLLDLGERKLAAAGMRFAEVPATVE